MFYLKSYFGFAGFLFFVFSYMGVAFSGDVSGFRHSSNSALGSARYITGAVNAKINEGVLNFSNDRYDSVVAYIHDKNGNIVKKIIIPGKMESNFTSAYSAITKMPAEIIENIIIRGNEKNDIMSSIRDYVIDGSSVSYNSGIKISDFPEGGAISYAIGTNETIAATFASGLIKSFTIGVSIAVGNSGSKFTEVVSRSIFDKLMTDASLIQEVAFYAAEGRHSEAFSSILTWMRREAIPAAYNGVLAAGLDASIAASLQKVDPVTSVLFRGLDPLANALVAASSVRDALIQASVGPTLLWFDMPYDSNNVLNEVYKFNWRGTPLKGNESILWENERNKNDDVKFWEFWKYKNMFEAEYDRYKPYLPTTPQPVTGEHVGVRTAMDATGGNIYSDDKGIRIPGRTGSYAVNEALTIAGRDGYNNNIQITGVARVDTNYQYTAWGEWSGEWREINNHNNQEVRFNRGFFVVGRPTTEAEMASVRAEMTGGATYNGRLAADYSRFGSNTVQAGAITGTVALTADFANRTMNGRFNMFYNNSLWASPQFQGTIRSSGPGGFNGTLSDNGQGLAWGYFYGPRANEAGGGFYFTRNTGNSADGVAEGIFLGRNPAAR